MTKKNNEFVESFRKAQSLLIETFELNKIDTASGLAACIEIANNILAKNFGSFEEGQKQFINIVKGLKPPKKKSAS